MGQRGLAPFPAVVADVAPGCLARPHRQLERVWAVSHIAEQSRGRGRGGRARGQRGAEGSADDTGWFLWPIAAGTYATAPTEPLRWLGDPWPLDIAGVDVDALTALGRDHGRAALHAEGRRVAQRTRPQALTTARRELLNHLATDLAKGVAPFDHAGLAGSRNA